MHRDQGRLHIWEDHFYPEVIDPATGAVLPDGEIGELVFTSLTKEAMPVIRYRTRDLTRLLPGTARTHAADGKGDRALRRHDDRARRQRVSEPDRGDHSQGRAAVAAFRHRAQARSTGSTTMTRGGGGAAGHRRGGLGRPAAAILRTTSRALIGVTAEVKTVKPGGVERSAGKAKRVIDLRRKS